MRRLRLLTRFRAAGRLLSQRASSSLTRRIVVLNLAGLVALLVGFLYLNQFRQGLIEARVQSLLTQGEIIAGAIAASATVETDTITIDPDRLLQMQAGETSGLGEDGLSSLEFPINPERVAPLLRRLVTPTRTRARIYDRDGSLLLDSRTLYSRGDILRFDLPPLSNEQPSSIERLWTWLRRPVPGERAPASRRDRAGERQEPARGPAGARRHAPQRRAPEPERRDDRLGRGPGAALPLGARRVAPVDAGRRHRRHHRLRALALLQVFLVAALVMVVLSLLSQRDRGPGRAPGASGERVRLGSSRARRSPISASARTRSAISRSRCGT
jgi:two-component system sensor histidine kinase ChvG